MGTFATRKIHRGEFIMQFQGESCSSENLEAFCAARNTHEDDALQVDDEEYLILKYECKVVNHSCEPNACFRNKYDLYALYDINPGEEITADYSTTVGIKDDWTLKCNCGSKHCRKNLGNVLTLPQTLLQYYYEQNALPNFIRLQALALNKIKQCATTTKRGK